MSGRLAKKVITLGVVIAIIALLVPFSVSCSKPPPPTAAFTFSYVSGELLIEDPIAGLAPLTVQFSDQSSGKITSWRWNLGDGTVVEGAGDEERNFTHEYKNANSSGYVVLLTVRGPGGKDDQEEMGVVTVFSCSEAANAELNEAKLAIEGCMGTAKTLDKYDVWDGSRGKVIAGGRDAADYLRVWKTFKATYNVAQDGTITTATDVSWGCIQWAMSVTGPRWRAK
jgi:PKD repeat protein